MVTESKRIGWVDLAKGFCILLVVVNHVFLWVNKSFDYPLELQGRAFRMPLYFVLSGLFFKQYENFGGFLKRKINKLLIPFLFFFIVTSILPCAVLEHRSALTDFFQERTIYYNNPIWFLLCLFVVNVVFYLVHLVAKAVASRYQTAIVLTMATILGFVGLGLGALHIRLPFYFDTALSALPLFAFGYWLFRHTGFMPAPVNPLREGLTMAACALVVWFLAVPTIWANNDFPDDATLLLVYLTGIAGTMMVLILSKFIRRLPLISFWGRYSIIILCTHQVVITVVSHFTRRWLTGGWQVLAVLVATLAVCHLLILFMRRYMPHVTAQRDVIRI